MKEKETITMEVTTDERDLIMAVRNYCKSYPNGYPMLLEFARDLFEELTDMPKE